MIGSRRERKYSNIRKNSGFNLGIRCLFISIAALPLSYMPGG
jgi:uncharacterized membrane protein